MLGSPAAADGKPAAAGPEDAVDGLLAGLPLPSAALEMACSELALRSFSCADMSRSCLMLVASPSSACLCSLRRSCARDSISSAC
jgi:hypothetical protein